MDQFIASLTIFERITLLGLLPTQGNFLLLQRTDELKKRLIFTEKEVQDWGIVATDTETKWAPDAAKATTDVEIGRTMWAWIAEALEKMDKENTLQFGHMGLYEIFVHPAQKAPLGLDN